MQKMFYCLAMMALLSTACTKDQLDLLKKQVTVEDNHDLDANNTSVPAVVLTAFKNRYPDATRIEWKKQSDGNFKAEFLRGSTKWQAIITPTGTLVKEEHN